MDRKNSEYKACRLPDAELPSNEENGILYYSQGRSACGVYNMRAFDRGSRCVLQQINHNHNYEGSRLYNARRDASTGSQSVLLKHPM